MKKYLLIILLIFCFVPKAYATKIPRLLIQGSRLFIGSVTDVSLIQATSTGQGSGSTTHSISFANNVTQGDLLVMGSINDGGGPTLSTVTDTQGNIWKRVAQKIFQFSTKDLEMWYATSTATGADTVTNTYSSSAQDNDITLAEYNANNSMPLDVSATGSTADGASVGTINTSATASLAQNNELLVAYSGAGINTTQSYTAGPYYNLELSNNFVNAFVSNALEDSVATSTTAKVATLGTSPNNQYGLILGTFKYTPIANYTRLFLSN